MSTLHNRRYPILLTLLSASLAFLLMPTAARAERIDCAQGMADIYPCKKIDLLAHLPMNSIGGGTGNDIWGWTDPVTGTEYVIMGRSSGTSFVDISDPENPIWTASLFSQSGSSFLRDVKVYDHYALIVAEAPGHGLQIFDLNQLRDVTSPPASLSATARYTGLGIAHNLAVNDESGFAFLVGGQEDSRNCGGGAHMIDIADPLVPIFAGCDTLDGRTHDAQCLFYSGPDGDHQGKEICFNSSQDALTVVDVTAKSAPALLARVTHPGLDFVHQGWLTGDQRYFLQGDEGDEVRFGHNTRTYIWDMADLDTPELIGTYTGPTPAIDHNLYIKGNFVYEANYTAGLRILNLNRIGQGTLKQVAFFDTFPANDTAGIEGAWSVFPFFESGVLAVSTIGEGLFLLAADLSSGATPGSSVRAFNLDKVTCRNLTQKETSRIRLDGTRKWNCFATNLDISSGDRLRQTLLGVAGSSNVRGSLKGVSPIKIICSNRSQGTKVAMRTKDPNFSCRDMGLAIDSGDRIQIKAFGRAE